MTDPVDPGQGEAPAEAIFIPTPAQYVSKAHTNLSTEVITVTVDKIQLCLAKHIDAAKARDAWQAPVAMLATIILAFTTASFKDFGLSKATWEAVFVIGGMLSSYWTVVAFKRAYGAPDKETAIERIVNDLKRQTVVEAVQRQTATVVLPAKTSTTDTPT